MSEVSVYSKNQDSGRHLLNLLNSRSKPAEPEKEKFSIHSFLQLIAKVEIEICFSS
jgi:hypothetical protein